MSVDNFLKTLEEVKKSYEDKIEIILKENTQLKSLKDVENFLKILDQVKKSHEDKIFSMQKEIDRLKYENNDILSKKRKLEQYPIYDSYNNHSYSHSCKCEKCEDIRSDSY